VLSIVAITEDYRKFSVQACVSEKPINNPVTRGLAQKLNWILKENDETKHLLLIFQMLSGMIQYLELDIDFRRASNHFQKDIMLPMLNIDTFTPFILNKKYTDLLIKALYVDINILNDGELYLAATEKFMKNLYLLFEDLRKEKYSDLSKRIQPLKEELIAAVMHPSRIEKMIESGISLEEITAIYSV
jgi:hypothetical protein